jgi:hypothetical protein
MRPCLGKSPRCRDCSPFGGRLHRREQCLAQDEENKGSFFNEKGADHKIEAESAGDHLLIDFK